jgi:Molybdopterin-guanine dinucleotide biosynthesis protein A
METCDENTSDPRFTHCSTSQALDGSDTGVITSIVRQISAAILAGGRARRFGGADKASLVVGGARIIERQLAALAAVTDDVRIVSNDPARYAALGVRVIPDQIAGAGPLGGLHAALVDAGMTASSCWPAICRL